jgi:hypothetical protein
MSGKVLRKAFWVGLDDPRHKLQSYKMIQMQSMASTTRCTKGGYGLDSRWTSGSGADCKESKTLTSESRCRWLHLPSFARHQSNLEGHAAVLLTAAVATACATRWSNMDEADWIMSHNIRKEFPRSIFGQI